MLLLYEGLCFLLLYSVLTNAYINETKVQFYFSEIALTIPEEARKNFRTNDPSLIVPHLYEGDIVTVDFETFTPMNMSIDNVTYSNDGGSDRVKIMLDGFEIGSFDTHSYSNWGEKWNDFYGSNVIGDWETVFPGQHTISFKVEHSKDCFGVELGTLYITLDVLVSDQTFWRNPRYKLAKKKQICKTDENVKHTTRTKSFIVTSSTLPPRSSTKGFVEPTKKSMTEPTTLSSVSSSTTAIMTSQLFSTSTMTISVTPSTLRSSTKPVTSVLSPVRSTGISTVKRDKTIVTTTSLIQSSPTQVVQISPVLPQTSRTKLHTTEREFLTSPLPGRVHLEQLSYKTDCMDKTNVHVRITRSGFEGTKIIARASGRRINMNVDTDNEYVRGKTTCGLDSWQLGQIDGDNTEFQHFVPHDIVTVKLKNDIQDTAEFPSKILPFLTPIIKISFSVRSDLHLRGATTFFVLGLVNVTKETFVGLQYNSRPMDTHFLTFTPKRHIMGWSLSDLRHGTTHFYLHFDTSVNTIMFDFLKFEIRAKEIRKISVRIAESGNLRIKGNLSPDKGGIIVTTDSALPVMNVEKIVIFYRNDHAFKYHAVLSIKSNGAICLYHSNAYKTPQAYSKRQLSDVSQFTFRREVDLINNGGDISSLNVNTKSSVLTIIYKDGSILITQLKPSVESTELLVKSFYTFDKKMNQMQTQTITFQSTHVNEYLAAVNEISDGKRRLNIMDNLDSLMVSDRISFKKTSPTNVFLASELLEVHFPK